jgi:hypothetical protein
VLWAEITGRAAWRGAAAAHTGRTSLVACLPDWSQPTFPCPPPLNPMPLPQNRPRPHARPARPASIPAAKFTHAARFLGKNVILSGLYNGQKLESEPLPDTITYSETLGAGPGSATFVHVLLRRQLQGAVLVGEIDLDETFEKLILDSLYNGGYGPTLLDPDIELDQCLTAERSC